jgi:hypothetical protein
MRLRVVGDQIITDELDVVAVFDPRLLPTRRDAAEVLLMQGAQENDWDVQQRCYEQQDTIDALEGRIRDLEIELEELRVV